MRDHYTTTTGWQMYTPFGQPPSMVKELSTQIDGCPYEINLRIELSTQELAAMGLNNQTEDYIASDLGCNAPEKEVDANKLMWDYIFQVKMIMTRNDTSGWLVAQWDAYCPFLFECDPALGDDEKIQKERDSWD